MRTIISSSLRPRSYLVTTQIQINRRTSPSTINSLLSFKRGFTTRHLRDAYHNGRIDEEITHENSAAHVQANSAFGAAAIAAATVGLTVVGAVAVIGATAAEDTETEALVEDDLNAAAEVAKEKISEENSLDTAEEPSLVAEDEIVEEEEPVQEESGKFNETDGNVVTMRYTHS